MANKKTQAQMPGAPSSAPAMVKDLPGATTLRVWKYPDSSYRVTLDTLIADTDGKKTFKHREGASRDIASLFSSLSIDTQHLKDIQ